MNRLTVVVGPAGVGKGTVVAALSRTYKQVWVSVSATTRPPRVGETEGESYYFVTPAAFEAMVADGEMLEWAWVHGTDRYGTPRSPVLAALAANLHPILEIDVAGARQVRQTMPGARFVFIAPPSFEVLVERLHLRGTENDEQIQRRLRTARTELAAVDEFDHIIVNDDISCAVAQLAQVMELVG